MSIKVVALIPRVYIPYAHFLKTSQLKPLKFQQSQGLRNYSGNYIVN